MYSDTSLAIFQSMIEGFDKIKCENCSVCSVSTKCKKWVLTTREFVSGKLNEIYNLKKYSNECMVRIGNNYNSKAPHVSPTEFNVEVSKRREERKIEKENKKETEKKTGKERKNPTPNNWDNPEYIYNPKTQRMVKKDGATGSIIKKYMNTNGYKYDRKNVYWVNKSSGQVCCTFSQYLSIN